MCIISKQIDAYCDIDDREKCPLCSHYRKEFCDTCYICVDCNVENSGCECEDIENLNVDCL
jgi:hypothetical protein